MTNASVSPSTIPLNTRVRYIKLGEKGMWEHECFKNGIIRFGFGSGTAVRFALCTGRRWAKLKQSFIAEGKNEGTATRFTNETNLFFEDDGGMLWITFIGDRLCWGRLTTVPAKQHDDGNGVWREISGGWRWHDLKGEELTKGRLSGALTKIAAYRGTSCNVDVGKYTIGRINGDKVPAVERAIAASNEMTDSILDMMRLLGERDFETLVDLVFSTSGWRRQGNIGKTQKTLDLDLILPSTGERAIVQVKSKTTSAELATYVSQLDDFGPLDRMFYVYHSGNAITDDERVTVIDPPRLSKLILEAGLTNWLIRKVA